MSSPKKVSLFLFLTVFFSALSYIPILRAGTSTLFSAVCFTVLTIAISFPFAWLTLRSGSLWPAVLLHASHNAIIQGIFDQLTAKSRITPYIIGEFGVGLALSSLGDERAFARSHPQIWNFPQ